MRKNLLSLMEVSKNKNEYSSLPFVFTTISGERDIVWFNFISKFNAEKCNIDIKKIFLIDTHDKIKTFDVNIELVVDINDCNLKFEDRKEYIRKFNEQFDNNLFDDSMELISSFEPAPLMDMYEAVIDYLKKPRKMTCNHCGSNIGFFTKLSGVQYYTAEGEDDGYEVDSQNTSVYCRTCKKKVCSFDEFIKSVSSGN